MITNMEPLLTDKLLRGEADEGQGALLNRERNLFEFARSVWRRRLLVSAIVVLSLLGGAGLIATMPSQYTAEAVLQLKTSNTDFADFDAVVSQQDTDELAVGSEIYVLASYPVALRVIDRLGLIDDPEFNPFLREPSVLAALLTKIAGSWMQTDEAAAVPLDLSETGTIAKMNVAANLLENLLVWNEGRSYTIFASFRSEDRVKAAEIANAFAEAYLQRQLDTNTETTENVSIWLDRRLEAVRQQVHAAEARIEAYRTENQLVDLGAEGSLARQQLSQINRQLAEVSVKRSDLEARLSRAHHLIANDNTYSIPEVIASSVVQQLRNKTTALDRRRTEIASIFGANHPDMKTIQADIELSERKVDAEIVNIVGGIAAELEVVIGRQSKLGDTLARLKTAVGNVDKANTKLRDLEREAEASRALFQSLATRREQALALQDAQQTFARLVAPAVPPLKPSHPNKIAALGLSLAGSLGVSFLLIAAFEYRDRDLLRTPTQIEHMFGLPCYGMIPEFSEGSSKGWFSWLRREAIDSFAVQGDAVRRVRNALHRNVPKTSSLSIMVISSLPSEGKTTFSTLLAQVIANAGQRTLLVDADIHRPSIARMLELDNPPADEAQPKHLRRIHTAKGGFDVLLLAEVIEKDADDKDPIACELPMRIKETAQHYDAVIIDTPPVVLMDDASLLADIADSIIYLVRWNKTPVEAVQTGIARLRSKETRPPVGLVLTRTDLARHARFGHKDESYFSEQYGYYCSRT